MNLNEMQNLPHKWWKKGVKYQPCNEDLPVDLQPFDNEVQLSYRHSLVRKLMQLKSLTLHSNIVPTEYDWYYAINTELLEYQYEPRQSAKDLEMADIAIFCALCLKYHFDYDIMNLLDNYNQIITIQVVRNKRHVIKTLIWALQSPTINYKINFNQRRIDHGCFRH